MNILYYLSSIFEAVSGAVKAWGCGLYLLCTFYSTVYNEGSVFFLHMEFQDFKQNFLT